MQALTFPAPSTAYSGNWNGRVVQKCIERGDDYRAMENVSVADPWFWLCALYARMDHRSQVSQGTKGESDQ